MASWHLASLWSCFFGLAPVQSRQTAPLPPKRPAPPKPRVASREALEVAWLLRGLPPAMQAALRPDLLALARRRSPVAPLQTDDYTWPGLPGVWRPPYASVILSMKTLEGLCSRVSDELRISVNALCTPQSQLARPMRNALLAMQGRRLGQVCEALGRHLEPADLLALFRQELPTLRQGRVGASAES